VKKLDSIYEQRTKDTEALQQEYQKSQEELDRLLRDRLVDTRTIELQFMRVELPRIELDKSRVLMVYRMWRVLDLEQYKKLQVIFDRQRAERGRGRGGAPTY
jgi:Spy/CpxP family protein refolding chaperone